MNCYQKGFAFSKDFYSSSVWNELCNTASDFSSYNYPFSFQPKQSGIWKEGSSTSQEVCTIISICHAASLKGRDWFGKNLFTKLLQNLMLLCTINIHIRGGGCMCAIFHIRQLYTVLNLLNCPQFFHTGSLPSVFCIFDCYVKLAFILILMSVFQLL